MLLTNAPAVAVLPATNLNRAKDFWTNKIGLSVKSEESGNLLLQAGEGTMIMVYERHEPTKAEHTVCGFRVNDLSATMKELKDRGVTFEEYDMPEIKTVNGVVQMDGIKSAWFKDSEGNIIAINEM